jgi:hypothetical protein
MSSLLLILLHLHSLRPAVLRASSLVVDHRLHRLKPTVKLQKKPRESTGRLGGLTFFGSLADRKKKLDFSLLFIPRILVLSFSSCLL